MHHTQHLILVACSNVGTAFPSPHDLVAQSPFFEFALSSLEFTLIGQGLLTLLFPFALFLPRVGLSLDLQFAHFLPRTAVCKGRNRVAVVPVVRLFASLIIIRHTAPTAAPAQCFTPFHLSAAPVVALRVSVRTSVPRNTPPPARRRPRSGRAGSSPSALGGRSGAAFATAWASAPPISTRGATRSGPGWRGQPAPPLGRTARVPGAAIAVRRGRVRRRAAPAAGRRGRAGDRSAGRGKTAGRGRAAVAVTVTAVGRGRARRGAAARVEPALVAWSGSGRTGARTRGRARAAARRRRRGWSTTTSRPPATSASPSAVARPATAVVFKAAAASAPTTTPTPATTSPCLPFAVADLVKAGTPVALFQCPSVAHFGLTHLFLLLFNERTWNASWRLLSLEKEFPQGRHELRGVFGQESREVDLHFPGIWGRL